MTKPIYISPEVAGFLGQRAVTVRNMISGMSEHMRARGCLAAVGTVTVAHETMKQLTVDTDSSATPFVSSAYPQDMNHITLFDHEMGHLVVKEAWPQNSSPHIAECAADAYAVLRHLQRFGNATDIFECAPFNIAEHALLQSTIHYSSAAIQAVERIRTEGKIDIAALSLQDTSRLAGEIGSRYSFAEETLEKIYDAYAPARQFYDLHSRDFNGFTRAVVEVMRQNKDDHDIYRAGKLYLSRPDVKDRLASLKKTEPSFFDIFSFMEQHEKDSGFIPNAAEAMDAQRPPEKPAPQDKPSAPDGPRIGQNLNAYC